MKIHFECASCEKSDSATATIISSAIEAISSNGKINMEPTTVVDCLALILFSLMRAYEHGDERLERLVEALSNKNDEVVKSLGIMNRQALGAVLSILKKQRKAMIREQEKRAEEIRTADSTAEDVGPSGGES
jgi:hypothetical protein